jgi:hypothetical protein
MFAIIHPLHYYYVTTTISINLNFMSTIFMGYAVARLVGALRYKPEVLGFDSQWCLCNFSLT